MFGGVPCNRCKPPGRHDAPICFACHYGSGVFNVQAQAEQFGVYLIQNEKIDSLLQVRPPPFIDRFARLRFAATACFVSSVGRLADNIPVAPNITKIPSRIFLSLSFISLTPKRGCGAQSSDEQTQLKEPVHVCCCSKRIKRTKRRGAGRYGDHLIGNRKTRGITHPFGPQPSHTVRFVIGRRTNKRKMGKGVITITGSPCCVPVVVLCVRGVCVNVCLIDCEKSTRA